MGTAHSSQPGGTYRIPPGRVGYSFKYLPNSAVVTPARESQTGRLSLCSPSRWKVGHPPPVASMFEITLWLWMYWERKIVTREGQQSESTTV